MADTKLVMTLRPFDPVTSLASSITSMGADGVTGRMTKNLNLSMDEVGFTICETEKLTKSMGEDGGTERRTKDLKLSMDDAGGTNCRTRNLTTSMGKGGGTEHKSTNLNQSMTCAPVKLTWLVAMVAAKPAKISSIRSHGTASRQTT